MNKVHYSSARDDWCTPPEVLDRVRRVGQIGLDPCWNPNAITDAGTRLEGRNTDGLSVPWSGHGLVYVNPPYGRKIGKWVRKCCDEARDGVEIIALLPARTDTRWFPWDATALAFWRGRLTFLDAPHPAPFPSVLAYWGPQGFLFETVFSDVAAIVTPRGG